MPSASDTAYPRFKINPSAKELNELYTPTVYELAFARERARQPLQRAGLLLLLKTFQRLGYFALCAEIPAPIIRHIFRCAGLVELPEQLQAYDASTARDRHTTLIREFLGVTAYGPAAREVVVETCLQAARTRDDLPDLINMAIEELIRQRFELPAFSTLLRIARTTRNTVNRRYQLRVCELLGVDARQRLLAILSRAGRKRSCVVESCEGVITENVRDEQRKFIKYNHLVANLLSFHTLVTMTKALQQLLEEGHTVDMEALSTLSPYRTEHINRFGNYVINPNRMPEPLEQHLGLSLSPVST